MFWFCVCMCVLQKNVEALIAEYQEQGKKQLQLVEEKVEEPSPRFASQLEAVMFNLVPVVQMLIICQKRTHLITSVFV